MTTLAHDRYEYAGFKFRIVRDTHGKAVDMVAEPGQHPAAYKEKHSHNALQMHLDDAGDFEQVRAAIRNPPAPAPESVPTPTRWRAQSSVVDISHHVNCPSCDEPLTIGASRCSHCGALL